MDQFPTDTAGNLRLLEFARDEIHYAAEAKRQQLAQGYSNDTLEQMIRGVHWTEAKQRLELLAELPLELRNQVNRILSQELAIGTIEQIDSLLSPAITAIRDAWEDARNSYSNNGASDAPRQHTSHQHSARNEEDKTSMIVIVTALALERDAILRRLLDVVEEQIYGRTIHRGRIDTKLVVVECLHGMGNIKSAVRTTQIIERWRPSAVLLVGIAGGTNRPTSELLTANDHLLGDVLVAEQIIDYESGKQTENGLEHRPQVIRSSARWVEAAKNLKSKDWFTAIHLPRPDGTTGRVVPQIHFGVVASGQKVIKDQTPLDAISELFTNLVGVEMEGFGAGWATFDRASPIEFLLLKAICDWADPNKNDQWQPYAADTAAACLAQLIRQIEGTEMTNQMTPTASAPQSALPPKVILIQRLGNSWEDLADVLQIPAFEKGRFRQGNEPRQIWEWLDARERLGELEAALRTIGRDDLAEVCRSRP